MKLLIFNASSSYIAISVKLSFLNQFSIVIEEQIAVVNIPTNSPYAQIANPSKIEADFALKEILSVRSQRRSLTTSHYIQLSEVTNHTQMKRCCEGGEISCLHCYPCLWLVENSMSVNGHITYVFKLIFFDELLDHCCQVLRVRDFSCFELKESCGLGLHYPDQLQDALSVRICLCSY